jgi:quinol-cytochrome oxidoreductase complex cytochrome b subunit
VAILRADRQAPTEKALGWLLAVAAAEFAMLAVTGVILIFFYRPSAANAWGDLRGIDRHVSLIGVVRIVHRVTAGAMVVTVLAVAVTGVMLVVARSLRTRRHGITAAMAVGIAVVGLFASFTGYLLPWDQLALWAVTVGTNMMGFMPIIRNSSQYVLIGGSQISVGTLRAWFFIRVLVVPVVLFAIGILAARRLFGRRIMTSDSY